MKAVIATSDLLKLIAKLHAIVPSKPTIPILGNLLFEASGDSIILSATDLTVSIKASTKAQVLEEGAITLPARRFFQLIRELTTPSITIEASTGEIASISSGSAHFRLHGMHKSEFPPLPPIEGGAPLPLSGKTFKDLLSRVSFAAAKEDSRHVLNAVLLEARDDTLTFTATDGKRLAQIGAPATLQEGMEGQYLIPLKAVDEMVKILDEDESVEFFLWSDKIGIESGSYTFISKLLSGEYPDVKRVIPPSSRLEVRLHREELLILLRQVALFTTEMNHSVKFRFAEGELTLSAMSSEVGEGKVSMIVDYHGEGVEIAFNPFYFTDILKHCKDETIRFGMNDSFNPGKITDTSSALFILMPMRLH